MKKTTCMLASFMLAASFSAAEAQEAWIQDAFKNRPKGRAAMRSAPTFNDAEAERALEVVCAIGGIAGNFIPGAGLACLPSQLIGLSRLMDQNNGQRYGGNKYASNRHIGQRYAGNQYQQPRRQLVRVKVVERYVDRPMSDQEFDRRFNTKVAELIEQGLLMPRVQSRDLPRPQKREPALKAPPAVVPAPPAARTSQPPTTNGPREVERSVFVWVTYEPPAQEEPAQMDASTKRLDFGGAGLRAHLGKFKVELAEHSREI